MHNEREREREAAPPTCNPTHARRGYDGGSAADGYNPPLPAPVTGAEKVATLE